jgi:Bacterial toxin 37
VDALQRKADALKEEIKNATGRSAQERASLEFDLAKVQAERLDLTHPNTGGASGKASIEAMQQAPAYQKMTPVEKLAYWKVLNYGMESGKVGAKDLANTAGAMWGIGQNKSVLALYPELSGKGLPTGIGSPGGFDASLALFGFTFAGTGGGLTLGITTTAGGLACPVCVAALAIAGDVLIGGLAAGGAFILGKEIAKGIQSVFKSSGVSPGILKSEPVIGPTIPTTPNTSPGPDWVWKGRPGSTPGDSDGNWVNTGTGETLRPDLGHPAPIGPHWDWKDPTGKWWRIYPDGRIEPK